MSCRIFTIPGKGFPLFCASKINYMPRILLFIIISSATLSPMSCNSENKPAEPVVTAVEQPASTEIKGIPVLDKLVGTWQSKNGKNFETWTKAGNGNYAAAAYSVRGKDTSWNEQASIYPKDNNWVFENTVRGQNDGKTITFTSSLINENSIQFSNPEHDFPTDVNYTIADENTLHAFIIGPNSKGGKDTIPFNYTRVK